MNESFYLLVLLGLPIAAAIAGNEIQRLFTREDRHWGRVAWVMIFSLFGTVLSLGYEMAKNRCARDYPGMGILLLSGFALAGLWKWRNRHPSFQTLFTALRAIWVAGLLGGIYFVVMIDRIERDLIGLCPETLLSIWQASLKSSSMYLTAISLVFMGIVGFFCITIPTAFLTTLTAAFFEARANSSPDHPAI